MPGPQAHPFFTDPKGAVPDPFEKLSKEATMPANIARRVLRIGLATGSVLFLSGALSAQNIVVDASPSHAVNSFSPPRALG
jgi:hypothetical protein